MRYSSHMQASRRADSPARRLAGSKARQLAMASDVVGYFARLFGVVLLLLFISISILQLQLFSYYVPLWQVDFSPHFLFLFIYLFVRVVGRLEVLLADTQANDEK